MTSQRNLLLFVLSVTAGFIFICNAIPQIKSEPVEIATEIGESPADLITAGKKIFMSDRAQCLTCHSLGEDPKARCPNQEGLGYRAPTRKPGYSAAKYLIESVYNPNAFIVSGYPKNQMQPINRPPIALSHDEILAVVAYLNTLGGTTDESFVNQLRREQEPWRTGKLKPETAAEKYRPPVFAGDAIRGKALFEAKACNSCHRIGKNGADVCPDLTSIGGSQSAEYILESIIDPSAVIVKGYRQVTIFSDDSDIDGLSGVPIKWIPNEEHPEKLILSITEGTEQVSYEINISDVENLGSARVVVEIDGELAAYRGEYVSGDEETGIILKMIDGNGWTERRFEPEGLELYAPASSPMPANFAEQMTPREIYDLVAFLLEQRGAKP